VDLCTPNKGVEICNRNTGETTPIKIPWFENENVLCNDQSEKSMDEGPSDRAFVEKDEDVSI
jgi:hypothetical protein